MLCESGLAENPGALEAYCLAGEATSEPRAQHLRSLPAEAIPGARKRKREGKKHQLEERSDKLFKKKKEEEEE